MGTCFINAFPEDYLKNMDGFRVTQRGPGFLLLVFEAPKSGPISGKNAGSVFSSFLGKSIYAWLRMTHFYNPF